MRVTRCALTISLLSAACSEPEFKEPAPSTVEADLALLAEDVRRYVEAVCDVEVRCGTDERESCLASYLREVCSPTFGDAKLPELDACVAALGGLGCTASPYYVAACQPVRAALYETLPRSGRLVGEGQECSYEGTTYCDLGLFCDADPEQCGLCQKQLALGNTCRPDGSSECGDGMFCSAQGVCRAGMARGSACSGGHDECAAGLFCLRGICQHTDDIVGATCASEEDCGYALPCREGQCRALKRMGEACSDSFDCESQACLAGACVEGARCGRGEVGMGCSWDAQCKPGHVCDWITGRCARAIADGESGCFGEGHSEAINCVTGSYCQLRAGSEAGVPANYVCVKGVPNGGACTREREGNECVSGYCNEQLKCALPPRVTCE